MKDISVNFAHVSGQLGAGKMSYTSAFYDHQGDLFASERQ